MGVTLHDELIFILQNPSMTRNAQALADAVNNRGRYRKRDGKLVTDSQVRARMNHKRYKHLF